LPARYGSQIGSSAAEFLLQQLLDTFKVVVGQSPVPQVKGKVVAAEAYSARGKVVPFKNAAFEPLMVAVNQVLVQSRQSLLGFTVSCTLYFIQVKQCTVP
jgi:hypothetical protein